MTKYNAKKTVLDGITFASRKESKRYQELKLLERAGEIAELRLQVPFTLLPKQHGEQAVKYIADFTYLDKRLNWEQVVEDTKGIKTPLYVIKRKLMLFIHGIKIREV